MARLSYMKNMIDIYLTLHGDKEVTSVSTHQGVGNDIEYTLNLHDIYEGAAGTNPYSGGDTITLWKNGHTKSDEMEAAPKKKAALKDIPLTRCMTAYRNMEKEIMESEKPLGTKIFMVWGALMLLKETDELDDETVNVLFRMFVFRELGLEDGPA